MAPTINLAPQDQTVIQGGNAMLHCLASGRPNPRVRWWKAAASGLFPVLRTAHIGVLRNGSLQIVDAQPSHGSVYICVAENALGEDRQSATVTVQGRNGIANILCASSSPVVFVPLPTTFSYTYSSSHSSQCRGDPMTD